MHISILNNLGVSQNLYNAGDIQVISPIGGAVLGQVSTTSADDYEQILQQAQKAFKMWRSVPAPVRGELIRLLGEELRQHKEDLGKLVTLEMGKILQEGLGEVQEMIDMCDFAVGLSRQLYGLTIVSERPQHKMLETWHPLGVVGVISAFNFPVAVWAWNFCLAIICGNAVVWKPSDKTPLTALVCHTLFQKALSKFPKNKKEFESLSNLVIGGVNLAEKMAEDVRMPLVSATGSCAMGENLAPRIAKRMGRALLELGGNNAMIVAPSADLDLALRAICFSALGTAGQRCTSLRRLIIHKSLHESLFKQLKDIYASVQIGSPMENAVLMGPLISRQAYDKMQETLVQATKLGGKVTGGHRVLEDLYPQGYYVAPALVEIEGSAPLLQDETFAPILYLMTYDTLEEAIELNNNVPQGLSSCIFTNDLKEAEIFVSSLGSDCGIANVNIGPSGAEIGGAFGGEKATGGGRESGSDSWKAYMRRATNTINYSNHLPLAQGIEFPMTAEKKAGRA